MSVSPRLRVVVAEPPELVVYDEPGECSYLEDKTWRLPLRVPVRPLTRREMGLRLAQGDRRQGRLLYRTACPNCRACQPIRLEVGRFRASKTQRRVFRRGDALITTSYAPIGASDERVDLYNLHKHGRRLNSGEGMAGMEGYRSFLGETCCDTFEMRYHIGKELLGVAVIDRAHNALSAVYCFWDPKFADLSPGVFSVLKQVELCERMELDYLYLGLYIGLCPRMSYKGRYLPHQRYIDGHWRRFDRRADNDAERYILPG